MQQTLPLPLDVKLMNWTASVLFLGCALLALAAGVHWLLSRPVFAIQRIVVQGDLMHNSPATLRPLVQPSLVGNFFTVDLDALRAAFEQAPWVRYAQVRREFPGTLRIELHEQEAIALWGPPSQAQLLNSDGEIFDAEADDEEQEHLPRLQGPQGQADEVLAMYRQLAPQLAPLDMQLQELALSGRGSWQAELSNGARLELGGGERAEVLARVRRLVRTLAQVTAQYQRSPQALEGADLRHSDGYALRLRGVTTITAEQAARAVAKLGQAAAHKPAAAKPTHKAAAHKSGQH